MNVGSRSSGAAICLVAIRLSDYSSRRIISRESIEPKRAKSKEAAGMLGYRITATSVVGYLLVTFAGCGQTPLMNLESNRNGLSAPATTASNAPQDARGDKSVAVPLPFIVEFQNIKETCDNRNRSELEELEKQYQSAMTVDQQNGLVKRAHELQAESAILNAPLLPQALELVRPHAADSAAVEPLVWITLQGGKTPIGQDAAALLAAHHLTNEKTIELAARHSRSSTSWVEPMLRAQLAAPDLPENYRPRLMLALAHALRTQIDNQPGDVEKLNELFDLYTDLQQSYAKTENQRGITFGDMAKSALYEIANLSTGKTAPEIEGEDLDGMKLKLSDYRGMVVMLSFWASWCGPCMALVPHERELVKRFAGRPFVLLGVNGDLDKELIKPILEQENITWRSFWCGEDGPSGPLPMKWNILGWPTVYLIDHRGVIQGKRLDDQQIEQLVIEAEIDAAGNSRNK